MYSVKHSYLDYCIKWVCLEDFRYKRLISCRLGNKAKTVADRSHHSLLSGNKSSNYCYLYFNCFLQ